MKIFAKSDKPTRYELISNEWVFQFSIGVCEVWEKGVQLMYWNPRTLEIAGFQSNPMRIHKKGS